MARKYDILLQCRCQTVRGLVLAASVEGSNRAVCLCDDCQAYGHFLGGEFLDANGGTEILQVAHNQVRIDHGRDQVACVRLSSKGLFRWYARCCNTPLANTFGPKSLFAGVARVCLSNATNGASFDEAVGPIRERVQGRYGKGELPPGTQRTVSLSLVVHFLQLIGKWWISGAARPSTFFAGALPLAEPHVLSAEERQAL